MSDRPAPADGDDTEVYVCRERRAAVRYRLPMQQFSRTLIPKSFCMLEGLVLDLSAVGIGVLVPRPVEVGTKVFVEVKDRDRWRGPGTELVAHVRRAEPHEDGGWLLGCALTRPLTDDQVQALR
jgi:PilZ domain